jgi:hypothetical protein
MISVSLNTKQFLPDATTCNWYIDINNKLIPIVENSNLYRKEPIKIFDHSKYLNFSGWTDIGGIFVALDFPIDVFLSDNISLFTNGIYYNNFGTNIAFLNSKLIYINNIKNINNDNYIIRYPISLYNSVNLYVLCPKPNTNIDNYISLGIVSVKKEVLEAFINDIQLVNGNSDGSARYLKDDFIVTNSLATIEEAKFWFGDSFNNCIFIDNNIFSLINTTINYNKYSDAINVGLSKLSSTSNNLNSYINNDQNGFSDLNILGSVSNIVPISNE